MQLLAPYIALFACSQVQKLCTRTRAEWTSFQKQNLVSFLPPEAICLGFKFFSVDDEKLIIMSHLNFIALTA